MRIHGGLKGLVEGMRYCLDYATDVYVRRYNGDTNPLIVQPIGNDGEKEAHWYYRSDQAVATSSWSWKNADGSIDFMGIYEGPVENLPSGMEKHFTKERYEVDEMETVYAMRRAKMRDLIGI